MVTRRDALSTAGFAALALVAPRGADAQTRKLTAEEEANLKVVDGFLAAFNARDPKRVAGFLADDARFSAGPIGKFRPLAPPVPMFDRFIESTKSVKMTVKPGSQQARGPMVTHERVDQ